MNAPSPSRNSCADTAERTSIQALSAISGLTGGGGRSPYAVSATAAVVTEARQPAVAVGPRRSPRPAHQRRRAAVVPRGIRAVGTGRRVVGRHFGALRCPRRQNVPMRDAVRDLTERFGTACHQLDAGVCSGYCLVDCHRFCSPRQLDVALRTRDLHWPGVWILSHQITPVFPRWAQFACQGSRFDLTEPSDRARLADELSALPSARRVGGPRRNRRRSWPHRGRGPASSSRSGSDRRLRGPGGVPCRRQ